jgi:glycosyltransferase involved in cell wall biosynthesis
VPELDTLHVAALPYPTSQGTQAAIGLMVDATARAGRSVALLTYASGAGRETRFTHLTPGGGATRSLRSGPSIEKIVADVALAEELARRAHDAKLVVAHHVEAAAIARALDLPRWVFVAHTVLAPELPTYLPRAMSRVASRLGHALDRRLATHAPWVAAISPGVAASMRELGDRDVDVLPVPIAPVAPTTTRSNARDALGIDASDSVVLYAGNLDRYQGLSVLVDAVFELRVSRPRARLLVATESNPRELIDVLERRRVPHTIASLRDETDRARVHAAADVAAVTRGTPGGFPIKLLDAVARDTPVVAMRRAMSGASFPGVHVVADDAIALARGLRLAIDATHDVSAARAQLVRAHHPARFIDAIDALVARDPFRSANADLR